MPKSNFDVLIVGAGFAGLYLLHRLRNMGLNARVLEMGDGVGGTWYWNRYPGARCDIESMQYSYQFDEDLQQEWEWSERYATQPEILKYADHVADRFDLRRDIQFNTRVESAHYEEEAAQWTLTSNSGDVFSARFCIMATGCLSSPNRPAINGLEDFAGNLYHTGEWPHQRVDFTGRRVAVIGTGSSAIQSLPIIANEAAEVFVFQRTANYSIPAHNRPLDPEYVAEVKANYPALRARAKTTMPGIAAEFNLSSALADSAEEQQRAYQARWDEGGLTFMGAYGDLMLSSEANETAANFVRQKIHEIVKDEKTAELLSPSNIIGGKRLCVDSNYYQTFNLPHVHLIDVRTAAIEEITATGIRQNNQLFEVDDLIIATGFDAMTGTLMKIDIQGREGVCLRERWANGPSSYLGLAMADFPNLFTVTGPGSPSVFTNMLPTIEQHVEWITDCIGYVSSGNFTSIEASPAAEADWWQHVQDEANVALKSTTDSWYLGANIEGKPRVFMPYIGGFPRYIEKCEAVVASGYEGFNIR